MSPSPLLRRLPAAAAAALLVGCLSLAGIALFDPGPPASLGGEEPRALVTRVVALGRIEPAGGVVSLHGPAGDRVSEILVREGQEVRAGDELVRFQGAELAAAELDLLRAQSARAAELAAEARAEADARRAEADLAQAQLVEAAELERGLLDAREAALTAAAAEHRSLLKRLSDAGTPEAEVARQRLLAQQAETELGAARHARRRLEAETKASAAAAGLRRATADRTLARTLREIPGPLPQAIRLAEMRVAGGRLLAPFAGRVLAVDARRGEAVGPTPLVTLADVSRMVVVAEVAEADRAILASWAGVRAVAESKVFALERAGPGDPRRARLAGRLDALSDIEGRNRLSPLDPGAGTSRRVFEARIALDTPAEAARYIRHEVTVTLTPGGTP